MSDAEPDVEALLDAIEEANDTLVEAIEWANQTAAHGEMRPSTHLAFKEMERAHQRLADVDPTRGEGEADPEWETQSPAGETPAEDVACADCGAYRTLIGPMDFDGDRTSGGDFVCASCAENRGALVEGL